MLAGKSGLYKLVKWVHIVEDEDATLFLHGGELVFTAGIRSRQKDGWLLNYAQNLAQAGASAFVVNLGPHISSVPQEVVDFCEKIEMPLFTIPWETRMVDMTRSFCEMILRTEEVETTMASCLKNILFQIGDANTHILQMERYGYLRGSTFCFVDVLPQEAPTAMLCRFWSGTAYTRRASPEASANCLSTSPIRTALSLFW